MSRSKFPNGVDQFEELFDLPYDKMMSAKRLTELKMKDVLSNDEQNEVMTLTSVLKSYLITPETMNKFSDALTAVEQFFYSNVQGFINNKQTVWDNYIKQFKYVGVWTAGKAYKFQNMVTDSNGNLHICSSDHTSTADNNPVRNQTLWTKASSKGDKGDIGLNAFYKGDWNSSSSYALGDAVSLGRSGSNVPLVYISRTTNSNKNPATNPTDWLLYSQIYVGETEHPGASIGLHYIKVTG